MVKPFPPSWRDCICFHASSVSSARPASLRILFNSVNCFFKLSAVILKSFILF
nr:MAG TPA: hypothetical protein [Caudoviricetes sp.]